MAQQRAVLPVRTEPSAELLVPVNVLVPGLYLILSCVQVSVSTCSKPGRSRQLQTVDNISATLCLTSSPCGSSMCERTTSMRRGASASHIGPCVSQTGTGSSEEGASAATTTTQQRASVVSAKGERMDSRWAGSMSGGVGLRYRHAICDSVRETKHRSIAARYPPPTRGNVKNES